MRKMISTLPEQVKKPLRHLRYIAEGVLYHGEGRFCPVCRRYSRHFHQFRSPTPREDALCVHCGSLERHRLLWLYLTKMTDLFDGAPKKILHVAPESCFEQKLKQQLGDRYLTADLFSPNAMVKMDITRINYPDQSFDAIYCGHVLEHVLDDRRAMREFYRVLKNNGWAILLVPITAEETYEDPSIVEPEERLKAFGQEDHVRRYGPDYVDRLREAGWHVEIAKVKDLAENDEAVRMGLTDASGEIYYCTK